MKIIKDFKVSENQKNFDNVVLIDNEDGTFVVVWKWTTMKEPMYKTYSNYEEAYSTYARRKKFANLCN